MDKMIIKETKANEISELTNFSRRAFDSDIEVGAECVTDRLSMIQVLSIQK